MKILYNTKTLILKCSLWGFFHFNEAWKSAFRNEARVLCFLLQNEAYVIKEMCLQIKFYGVRICTALHRQSWITERGKLCKYKIFPTGLLREKFAGLQFNYTCSGPKLPVSGSQPALTGFMRFSKCLTYPFLSFLIHKMKKVRGPPDRTLWDYMNQCK